MDIKSNIDDYNRALEKAHEEFPLAIKYKNRPEECNHNYSFCVFCDGGDLDIVRCLKCGSETLERCTFDEDYE